jgi:hypothetical protein
MCAATSEATGGFVTVSSANVTASVCPANATFGSTASVTVKAAFHAITPFIGALLGGQDILLGATANAQCAVFPVAAVNTTGSGNCTIPNLTTNTDPATGVTTTIHKSDAAALWSEAGFTGGVTPIGDATDWSIVAQSPADGGSAACTSGVTIRQSAAAQCTVPGIGKNWYFSDYQPAWTAAGFTGALTDLTGDHHIATVTPTPLTLQSCTSTGTVDN